VADERLPWLGNVALVADGEKSKVDRKRCRILLYPLPCGKRGADVFDAQASRRPQGDGYRPGLAHNACMKLFDVQPLNVKIDNRDKERIPTRHEIVSHTQLLLYHGAI
jgi:hypothetical protein